MYVRDLYMAMVLHNCINQQVAVMCQEMQLTSKDSIKEDKTCQAENRTSVKKRQQTLICTSSRRIG